jgi:tRNA-specific 2-thiouridylase
MHTTGPTNKAKSSRKVVAVGMSGGVDSSVAASLLLDQGYDVIGLTGIMTEEFSRCCAPEDVETAARVSDQLGIPHHVIELHDVFKEKVIEYFASEYLSGRTPSPCVECNRHVKFGLLMEKAIELGADLMSTGHYVRTACSEDDGVVLMRGMDADKDQSYFLAMLTQAQLSRSIFPLGEMKKKAVVAYCEEKDLAARSSTESQELCFVEDDGHGRWLDVRRHDTLGEGDIIDTDGKKLGVHKGIHHYTVGQRKGLGVAVGHPVYVVRVDAQDNTVVLGEREDTMRNELLADGVNWLSGTAPAKTFDAQTQIRYRHRGSASKVTVESDTSVRVVFEEDQFAIAPGQLAVFYDGEQVLGSGYIEEGGLS